MALGIVAEIPPGVVDVSEPIFTGAAKLPLPLDNSAVKTFPASNITSEVKLTVTWLFAETDT